MPQVTVIIPIYNTARYLGEALESIAGQTFSDFEVLLFDDGSTDNSAEIARGMAARDARFVLLGGKHQGYTHWLNIGLEQARGDLIARMDGDDLAAPHRFERQVLFLKDHPECCLLGTQATRIDAEGLSIGLWAVPCEHDEIDQRHINGASGQIIHPTVMMRACAARKIGGYRREFEPAEDYDLFLRMAEIGRLANLSESLLRYRLHSGSVTLSRVEAQRRIAGQVLAEAWQRRRKTGPIPTAKEGPKIPSSEDLYWWYARLSFNDGHFATSRKYARRLLLNRPGDVRRWVLMFAACLGPVALSLKPLIRYRPGRHHHE
jgi:glycosyltransferase involved in cell wall biosynthesis